MTRFPVVVVGGVILDSGTEDRTLAVGVVGVAVGMSTGKEGVLRGTVELIEVPDVGDVGRTDEPAEVGRVAGAITGEAEGARELGEGGVAGVVEATIALDEEFGAIGEIF